MDAVAEGEMAIVGAPDVKAVGLRELVRVPVRCVDHQEEALSRVGSRRSRWEHLRARCAPSPPSGRRSAAAPPRPTSRDRDLRATLAPAAGCRRSASAPLPMRFVVVSWPANRSSTQLATSSSCASPSVRSSAARSAVTRSSAGAARRRATSALEVAVQLDHAVGGPLVLVGRHQRAPDEGRQLVRPRLELVGVVGRNTQEVPDDGHRQGVREVADQIRLTGRGRVGQQTVDDRFHA